MHALPAVTAQETLISEYEPDKERSFLVSMMLFELVRGVGLSFADSHPPHCCTYHLTEPLICVGYTCCKAGWTQG